MYTPNKSSPQRHVPGNVTVEGTRIRAHVARRVLRVVRYYVLVLRYTPPVYAILGNEVNVINNVVR